MRTVGSSAAPSTTDTADLVRALGLTESAFSGGKLVVRAPINGAEFARVTTASRRDDARLARLHKSPGGRGLYPAFQEAEDYDPASQ